MKFMKEIKATLNKMVPIKGTLRKPSSIKVEVKKPTFKNLVKQEVKEGELKNGKLSMPKKCNY